MKTVTTSYWIPVTVNHRIGNVDMYTGFSGKQYPPIHEFMEKVIDSMTYKYGNVAAMYYVIEDYHIHEEDGVENATTLHVEVIVSSVVAGEAHAEDTVWDDIPVDLADTFMELWETKDSNLLIGYDLNPCKQGPNLNVDNGW